MDKNKYRGLTLDTKEWVYGSLFQTSERAFIIGAFVLHEPLHSTAKIWLEGLTEVDPETVGQFVCLDKNRKEVFDKSSVWFFWMGKKSKARINKGDFFSQLEALAGENVRGLPRTLCRFDIKHIELIEETNA